MLRLKYSHRITVRIDWKSFIEWRSVAVYFPPLTLPSIRNQRLTVVPIGKQKKKHNKLKNYETSDKIMKLCETPTTPSTLMNKKNNNWEWRATSYDSFSFFLFFFFFFGLYVGLRWFSYDGSVSSDNDKNEVKLIEAYHVTVGLCVWLLTVVGDGNENSTERKLL